MFKCYRVACQQNITFTCDAPHRVHAITDAEMGLPRGKPIFIFTPAPSEQWSSVHALRFKRFNQLDENVGHPTNPRLLFSCLFAIAVFACPPAPQGLHVNQPCLHLFLR